MTIDTPFSRALDLLVDAGVRVDARRLDGLRQHAALVRRWNEYVSLVSLGDLEQLLDTHTADALSLVPLLASGVAEGRCLVDLGSGGGFPALPVKVMFPELPLMLVERVGKKVGVLRNMAVALGLEGVEIVQGTFPEAVTLPARVMVTARAIEKPGVVNAALAAALPVGGVFWCPSGDTAAFRSERFDVVEVRDDWGEMGLRRGTLHRVERRAQASGDG